MILSMFFHGYLNQNTVTYFTQVSNHCSCRSERTPQEWYFWIPKFRDGRQKVLRYAAESRYQSYSCSINWKTIVAAFSIQQGISIFHLEKLMECKINLVYLRLFSWWDMIASFALVKLAAACMESDCVYICIYSRSLGSCIHATQSSF